MAEEPARNPFHLFYFNSEVGSLPPPQRINALSEPDASRNGGQGRSSFIIGKGLAFPDFWSRLQHLSPAATEARLPDSEAAPAPRDASRCPPEPGKLARRPALRGYKP